MVQEAERDIDFALMRRIQSGDMVAFSSMVDRYKNRLMAVTSRMLASKEGAEGIVQDTFVKVFQHRNSFDFQHCYSTWIYTVCLNLARNELRRRKRSESLRISESRAREERLAIEMTRTRSSVRWLDLALRKLPEKYRTAFLLRDTEEMKYEELAAVLGVPLTTAKYRVNRARSMLRDELLLGQDSATPRRRYAMDGGFLPFGKQPVEQEEATP